MWRIKLAITKIQYYQHLSKCLWVRPLVYAFSLRWRHNGRDSVSNHQPHDCLLNGLFRRRSKKTSKLRVTGLCVGNSPMTGEFPARRASNAENISIWWRHHVYDGIAMNSDVNGYDTTGSDMELNLPTLRKEAYQNNFIHFGGKLSHAFHEY